LLFGNKDNLLLFFSIHDIESELNLISNIYVLSLNMRWIKFSW